ncbi:MAG: hypothetical protein OEV06_12555, partial [Anaerolineae bacterium]|nr:hypothetical protein [Anaerolineae bacterium]
EGSYIQITKDGWDDIHPAISPDGRQVAYASNRGGFWDIYTLDISDGVIHAVTDDPQYDGRPTWSPDGAWIAYETYLDDNLEIAFALAASKVEPIRLTTNSTSDHSPAWSPIGRKVAFVSDRTGSWDIWLVDLDESGSDRMQNFTTNTLADQFIPNWSVDGKYISWSAASDGVQSVYFSEFETGMDPIYALQGSEMHWGPDNVHAAATFFVPEAYYLAIYERPSFNPLFPPIQLPGQLEGMDWGPLKIPTALPEGFESFDADELASELTGGQAPSEGAIFGRQLTLPLGDVEAPHAELSALAVEPFFTLRERVLQEAGWDVLSSLEQAFVPLTEALEPGRSQDWLYTGRAFTLPPTYLDVGWLVAAKEEYTGRVYWRVFVRAMKQDGSQGRPLRQQPWDFNARFSSNTTYYEQGGTTFTEIPPGYWVDFTALAQAYGWERLPALSSWQFYFHAARFNEFVITSGLEWEDAMLQLYPPEILATPSPVSR